MNRTPPHRRAATLVELVAGLAIMTVLMGGLASAMTLASRAIPDPESPLAAGLEGYHAAEQIVGDLYCAQSFAEMTATSIQFTVADRDPGVNPGAETIRYEWSGTPGDPLTRKYNGNPTVDLLAEVYEFALTYDAETKSETTTQETTTLSEQIPLATFDGWGGGTGTPLDRIVNVFEWASQYFEYSPPAEATGLIFTQADVVMYHGGIEPTSFTIAIHRSLNDGSFVPESAPIGTPDTLSGSELSTMESWKTATFSDVTVSDLSRSDYCLVLKGGGITPAYAGYYWDRKAPPNGIVMRWTEDSGASWEPPSNDFDKNDLRFHVWGKYESTTTQEVSVDQFFLRSVRIQLAIDSDPSTRVITSVPIVNAPEVVLP